MKKRKSFLSRISSSIVCLTVVVLVLLVPKEALAVGSYGVNLSGEAYQTAVNPFFAAGFGGRASDGYDGECTWYAWGRAYEKLGVALPCRGNANTWTTEAANAGFATGTEARANSIMVEHYSGTGHVFFVEDVSNGYAYVTEGNWNGYYHEDSINLSTQRRTAWPTNQMGSIDYIYLGGSVNRTPVGSVDVLEGGQGYIHVAGWAKDDDTPDAPLKIHVYLGGPAGSSTIAEVFIIDANKYRSDVGWHSYDEILYANVTGAQDVYVYAINSSDGANPCLNENSNKRVTISGGTPMREGYERTVPDGYYQIVSALDNRYELDVDGVDTFSENPNVQVWKNRDENMDYFYVTYNDGFYEIKHSISGLCMDVTGASVANKANIGVYADNDSDAQRWAIKPNGGYWNIEAKVSGYRLDVDAGRIYEDSVTNVRLFSENDTDAQKWLLIPYAPLTDHPIVDGDYRITYTGDKSKAIGIIEDIEVLGETYSNAVIKDNDYSDNLVFTLKYKEGEGVYIIKHKASGKNLDVQKGGTTENVGVWEGDWAPGGDWQKWTIVENGDGYGIVSQHNGKFLDLTGNDTTTDNNIIVWLPNLSAAETWSFDRVVDGVSLDKPSISIKSGDKASLIASVSPSSAANKSVIWESNNTDVAEVSQDGEISAKQEGNAIITVKTVDGGYTATCEVTVEKKADVTDPEDPDNPTDPDNPVDPDKPTDPDNPVPTPTPSSVDEVVVVSQKIDTKSIFEGSYKKYSVTPKENATITNKGILTPKKSGTVTITGFNRINGQWVADTDNAISIEIEKPGFKEDIITLTYPGATMSAVDNLNEMTSTPSKWVVSNKKIATVDPDTGVVTAVKAGTVKVTAQFGEKKGQIANYSFTVKVVIPSISKKSATMLTGATLNLKLNKAIGTPEWSSEDETIAEVNDSGQVIAHSTGETVITASLDGIDYNCKIKVKKPTLSSKKLTIKEGNTKKISLKNTKLADVEWSTSDESIATVDDKGIITAVGKGTVEISTTTGGCTDVCVVTIK